MANDFTKYVAGATVGTVATNAVPFTAADGTKVLCLPVSALNSFGAMADTSKGEEIAFCLIDTLAPKVALAAQASGLDPAATAITGVGATEAQRVSADGVLRKDYTFRFDVAFDENNLDVIA